MRVELLNLDNVKQAFSVANNAIYFADRSDYKSALYEVCKTLNPTMDDKLIGSKYIEEDIEEHKERGEYIDKVYVTDKEFDRYLNKMNEMYSHLRTFEKSMKSVKDQCFVFNTFGLQWTSEQYEKLQKLKKETDDLVDNVKKFLD